MVIFRNFKRESYQLDSDNDDYSSELKFDDESSRDSNQVPSSLSTNRPIVLSNVIIVSPNKPEISVGETTYEQASEFLRPVTPGSGEFSIVV